MRLWSTHWTHKHTCAQTHTEHSGLNKWRKVRKSTFLQWLKPHKSSFIHIQACNNPQHWGRPPPSPQVSGVSEKFHNHLELIWNHVCNFPLRYPHPKTLWSRCLQHPHRSQGYPYTEMPSGSVLLLCMNILNIYMSVWRPCNTWAQICNVHFSMYVYV